MNLPLTSILTGDPRWIRTDSCAALDLPFCGIRTNSNGDSKDNDKNSNNISNSHTNNHNNSGQSSGNDNSKLNIINNGSNNHHSPTNDPPDKEHP